MKRLILVVLLSFISYSSLAGWVKVLSNDNYNKPSPCDRDCYFFYVDLATISKIGDTAKVWRMNDFDTPQALVNRWAPPSPENSKPHLSVRIQEEYNCKEQQVRVVFVSHHSGHMGGGQTVSVNSVPDKWFSIGGLSSDVPTKLLWRAICEKP